MTEMTFASDGVADWVSFPPRLGDATAIETRCTPEFLTEAIRHLGDLEVVSAFVNTSGEYTVPPPPFESSMPLPSPLIVGGLPDYCDIVVQAKGPGDHIATITIWVPLNWNDRFLATLGGGNRTDSFAAQPPFIRSITMPTALRNGFATATTDGANKNGSFDWGLDRRTGDVDWDLTENWVHRSTHEMAVIAKTVTEAIHGRGPQYSYAAGCSGGGRQALVEAQRYPEDFDGIWASDPGINWTRFIPASLWPAVVMKEIAILPPAKLRAFREAAIAAFDEADGLRDGIVGGLEPRDFDARQIIGLETEVGEITKQDADAMNLIWTGPRTRDGEFLWHGLGAGNESWADNILLQGTCLVTEVDGALQPAPWDLAIGYLRGWVMRDLEWDWRTLTLDNFEEMFSLSVQDLASVASDDPDLTRFRDSGGKLLITHGTSDFVVPHMGTVDYYRQVIEAIGSEEETRRFARLFLSEGDGHGVFRVAGPGATVADALSVLMRWVELDEEPDEILGRTLDLATLETVTTRPIYAYPFLPRYRGSGDIDDAASFDPVHFDAPVEPSP